MPSIGSGLDSDVKRFMVFVAFATAIATVTAAWATTEAQINGKANKTTVDSLVRGMNALLIFACREPKNAQDTYCAGVPK